MEADFEIQESLAAEDLNIVHSYALMPGLAYSFENLESPEKINFLKQLSSSIDPNREDKAVNAYSIMEELEKDDLNGYNALINSFSDFSNIKDSVKQRINCPESFSASKSIRGTISNMVNQLTNIPTARPGGGGGINVDVDIPGSDIERKAPKSISEIVGPSENGSVSPGENTIGRGVVNALSDTGSSIQPASSDSASKIPEDLVEKFSSIVDRFGSAIESLIRGASGEEKPNDGISSTASSSGNQPGAPRQPGSPNITTSGEGTPEQQAMLKTLRYAEGTSSSYGTIYGGNVVKELEEGKLPPP